jgi:hypothetical protein
MFTMADGRMSGSTTTSGVKTAKMAVETKSLLHRTGASSKRFSPWLVLGILWAHTVYD